MSEFSNNEKRFYNGLKKILADADLRRVCYGFIREYCHLYDVTSPNNSEIYKIAGKREVGMMILNAARAVDFSGIQLAEKEYFEDIGNSNKKKQKETLEDGQH